MKIARTLATATVLSPILLASVAIAATDNPWARAKNPTTGPAQVYGSYGAGCIAGAIPLPLTGEGYQVVRTSRNRFYGHPNLINFAKTTASELYARGIVLLTADMAQPRGGPMPGEHASHNLGLDLDFWFVQDERALKRPLTIEERETATSIQLADLDRNVLNEEIWNWRYEEMLRTAAQHPQVERIFVHPAIKKKLCADPNNHQDWLRKIRPWWGHNAHFHVRLACPSDSPKCIPQAPQESIACDDTLEWWFSDEWRQEYERRKSDNTPPNTPPPPLPTLPKECNAVLNWKK